MQRNYDMQTLQTESSETLNGQVYSNEFKTFCRAK